MTRLPSPLAVVPVLWLSLPVAAQSLGTTTGDLRGDVRDETGATIPSARLSVRNLGTGLLRGADAGTDGRFSFPLLPPGRYVVSAEAAGFAEPASREVELSLGTTRAVHLVLRRGVAASVTVTAEGLDARQTSLATTIDRARIESLPNVERNYLSFALTTPRVSTDRSPQNGAAATSGLSLNGQSPRYNTVLVDGTDNNDLWSGSVRGTFSQEAVLEYQVLTNPYSAELGRTSGGVVSLLTRSGTNDLHASAFYSYRGDELAARDPLVRETVPVADHRFGASLGGPLLADRLFYFGAYERAGVDTANPVTIAEADAALIRAQGFRIETGNVPYEMRGDTAIVKLDGSPSGSVTGSLRGSWSKGRDGNQLAWGGLTAKSAGGERLSRDTALAASAVSILGSGAHAEVRALFCDADYEVASLDVDRAPSVTLQGVATFGSQRLLPQPRRSRIYQLAGAFSLAPGSGRVRLKAGAEIDRTDLTTTLPNFFLGVYRFSALAPGPFGANGVSARDAFTRGLPAVFIQAFGDPTGGGRAQQVSGFLQGELDVTPSLLVRAGVRYDYEAPAGPFPADRDNVAPRLSFSLALSGHTRLRGGVGRFHGVSPIGPGFVVTVQNGVQVRTYVRALGVPATSPGLWPTVPWALPAHRFATEAEAGQSVVPGTVLRPGELESMENDQASLGAEAALGPALTASVDAVHARGRNVIVARNVNPVVGGRRPIPGFGDYFLYESSGRSWYTGATLGLKGRIAGRLEASAYYTYARAEDDYIDFLTEFQPQDPLDPGDERARSVQSPEQKVVATAVFRTPAAETRWWARDLTLAAILDWQNGRPYNVTAGFDRNANGDPLSDRPEGVRRNAGELGSLFSLDVRVSRRLPLNGPLSAELTVTATNVTNARNVLSRQGVANLPTFDEPTVYGPARLVQIGARLEW